MVRPLQPGAWRAKAIRRVGSTCQAPEPMPDLMQRYQRAAAAARLRLWVQHRELRHDFDERGKPGDVT